MCLYELEPCSLECVYVDCGRWVCAVCVWLGICVGFMCTQCAAYVGFVWLGVCVAWLCMCCVCRIACVWEVPFVCVCIC